MVEIGVEPKRSKGAGEMVERPDGVVTVGISSSMGMVSWNI